MPLTRHLWRPKGKRLVKCPAANWARSIRALHRAGGSEMKVRPLPRSTNFIPSGTGHRFCWQPGTDRHFKSLLMDTLKLILIVLPIIEIAIFIWLLIRKDKKQKRSKPVPDDGPGHYEDIEYAERPFIEYFN